ncbi:O-methyltransferase [Tricladium varicosporioides]|nr:O-methyltransferase [Hymenoscyphus varicosporioides]
MFFDLIPAIMAMPRTLVDHQYKAPTKETGTPYKWAHGEELWTWLGSHPDRALNMVAGMRSHNPADAYPWGIELGKLNLKDEDVAIVDVAGGQGHIMEEIRNRNPSIKARFIVQDLPSTFEAVPVPPEGVEFMTYDIFTPQPVKDAFIYHYRHIFHNWSDDDCTTFLGQVVPLLKAQPKSKLLLVDVVLPDSNATMQEAIMDISMFPMGGMERNESQWRVLLSKSGLGIKKIWRGSEPEACVECQLL